MQIKNIPIIVERSIAQSPLQQKQSSSYLYLESRIAEAVRTEENKPRFRDLQPRECQEVTPNWAAVSQRVPTAHPRNYSPAKGEMPLSVERSGDHD